MIYTVIYDPEKKDNNIEIKKDCRVLRQSILPLPEDIKEYINKAKNPCVRAEREAAYTSLLCSLKVFFSVEDPIIVREKSGRPIITSHDIYFSISHCDGLVAISISNEGEIGLDIQSMIEERKEKAIEERYLKGFVPSNKRIDTIFYLCNQKDDFIEFTEITLPYQNNLKITDKWVALESILKLSSKGFGNLSNISALSQESTTDIRFFEINKTLYSLANSIKNG